MRRLRKRTVADVIAALRNALDLDGPDLHDEFDMFLSQPIADPRLEKMRNEILVICTRERPPAGADFGPVAQEWLRQTLRQLETSGNIGSEREVKQAGEGPT